MGILLLTARFALAAIFGFAGLAKLHDAQGSRKSLGDFGVPAALTFPFTVLLTLAELACAVALLRDRWVVPGALGVMTLLAVFIAGITISLFRGRAPNCHCFGQLSSSPVSWRTLVRNLALMAVTGVVACEANQVPSGWSNLSPNSYEIATLAGVGTLAIVFGLTLWCLIHMLRQNGRLLLRLEAVEKRLGINPDADAAAVQSLNIGDPAPGFELRTPEGSVVRLQTLTEVNKPLLLVFNDPDCGACVALQPELAEWQREYEERLTIVKISRGQPAAPDGLRNVLVQADREVAQAYGVTAMPSAVLVADGKIASRIEAGSDAIRALVGRASLPLAVKRGDPVPSVRLPDLNGNTVDLAAMRGRRTLLLFWSPSCGFCQRMLQEVKAWKRLAGSPEVVVISSGSIEANRAQGFPVKVLVDPGFGWGRVFGVAATPAAVVLDERGVVVSDVGVGASSVFALAGAEVPAAWR